MDEAASLEALQQKRKQLWAQVEALGDFRRGSLSANFRKCGRPTAGVPARVIEDTGLSICGR